MNKKIETLQRILQLSEFVKFNGKDSENHHRLKTDLGKSSKRIIWLLKRNGPLNQRQISKELNISPQAISEAVKKLETANFIIKERINKNETQIKLTDLGEQHALIIKERIQKHADSLLSEFEDEELQVVIDFINKIINKEKKDV